MKQHMMTHKNRDGTPISAELLNSVNLDRSRSRSSVAKDSNKSNSSDDFAMHQTRHRLPRPPPPAAVAAGNNNSLAAMMLLGASPPNNVLKEHCLSLTIQHHGGPAHLLHDGALPLKEQNNSTAELLLAQQQQQLHQQQRGANRSHSSASSGRAAVGAKKRGKTPSP